MGLISEICAGLALPRMVTVRQTFDRSRIERDAIPEAIFAELSRSGQGDAVKPGMGVAITCGSRGVANIDLIIKTLAGFVKSKGGRPFIVPAMGSHGGATAEGQKALIESYGVTEEFTGCPILSSMETVVIGRAESYEVRIDRHAAEAGGIIVAGRIKPHTDFHGPYESGIMKMMAIGLGKREGADICHREGFGRMARMVPLFGRTILEKAPVIMGFGILENAYCETCQFAAMSPGEIGEREPELLEEARRHLPAIFFDHADVLVVDRIGKDISGDGMDPNVTGSSPCAPFVSGGLNARRTVILDLTEGTHGCAFGMGAAHAITRRFFNKIDFEASYVNALTSRGIDYVRVPCVLENDREAIQLALRTCVGHDAERPRIIRIRDSLHTEIIRVSEAMEAEARADRRMEVLEGPREWPFDPAGNLW
jgi:hypothetical protein